MGSVRLRRAALVLGLVVAPLALQACGGGGSTKAASSSSSARTAPSSTTSSTVPKPDQTPKDAALEAPITTGSFQVVFHGVTVPYVPTNNFDKPAAGTVLVTVDTEVKNTGAAVAEFFADMFAVEDEVGSTPGQCAVLEAHRLALGDVDEDHSRCALAGDAPELRCRRE